MARHVFILAAATSVLLAGCGPKIPQHDGYKSSKFKPWEKPRSLEWDEDNEAEVDDYVDYAKRKRARWYMAELPGDGEMVVEMRVNMVGDGGDNADDEEFDLAFEILDEKYRVISTANMDDEDAGDRTKERTLYELPRGKYFVHVYAQNRLDKAEYTLELKYRRASLEPESNFPQEVGWPPVLALVPVFDDAPIVEKEPEPKKPKKRPKKRPKKTAEKPPKKDPPKQDPKETETETDDATAMDGRIVSVTSSGGGTRITINRGSSRGVKRGWKGYVKNSKGAIPDGSFTIDKVTASESFATVKATRDAVEAAGKVRISP